jgi:V8-like Glu-specific endopeptidase
MLLQEDEDTIEEKLILNEKLFPVEKELLKTFIHQSIGAFTFTNSSKFPCAGSGVLVSRNLILTAAHNLYDKKTNQELNKKSYRFYLQAEADGIAKRYYEIDDWRFPP